jgi:predicted nucleic-acid-binding Zn-ribbon protein
MKAEPGKWYFVVVCRNCGEAVPFAEAPSSVDSPSPTSRGVELDCPHCHAHDTYRGGEVLRQAEDFSHLLHVQYAMTVQELRELSGHVCLLAAQTAA